MRQHLLLILLSGVPAVLVAQSSPVLLRVHGDLDVEVLFGVKAAAVAPGSVVVLTDPEPAIHLFAEGIYASWGAEGGGPAELRGPVDIAWVANDVLVLDLNQHKLVTYTTDGAFRQSRTLGGTWANRFFVVGEDTVLATFIPMGRERAIVRIRGDLVDTVLTYSRSEDRIRLEARGAPSWTTAPPFTPQPRWTVLRGGLIAFWQAMSSGIQLLNVTGAEVGHLGDVGGSYDVSREDREFWFADAIPSEFMGQRVFEPIRRVARETVTFPEHFPPVLDLYPDADEGLWIRKTTAGSGEVWTWVDGTGTERGSLRFPRGRRLLAVGFSELAVLTTSESDIEQIEIYQRPLWAQ
jgi:hypothetical protein